MADNFRSVMFAPADRCIVLPDYDNLEMPRDYTVPVLDSLHRPLSDLRISVTDRCNLRCTYCMPREIFDGNHAFLPRTELLSFEEIERIARQFIRLGVKKIRLTGGEPLLRHGIERLIEKLSCLQTVEGKPLQIALTTNGVILARKARALREAGLDRVTVSLDGLSDATFKTMSDSNVPVAAVLDGIATAQAVGFEPVKVNMVVKRNVNEHEIEPMARHFRHSGIVLRFIEFMDVGSTNGWRMDDVVPASEILERIAAHYPLQQVEPGHLGEVAARWRYADGGGEIGVIASVTQAFCHECTRARISTDGKLYTCLFAGEGLDLRAPMRAGINDHGIANLIADQWRQRNDRYSQLRHLLGGSTRNRVEMHYIGG